MNLFCSPSPPFTPFPPAFLSFVFCRSATGCSTFITRSNVFKVGGQGDDGEMDGWMHRSRVQNHLRRTHTLCVCVCVCVHIKSKLAFLAASISVAVMACASRMFDLFVCVCVCLSACVQSLSPIMLLFINPAQTVWRAWIVRLKSVYRCLETPYEENIKLKTLPPVAGSSMTSRV